MADCGIVEAGRYVHGRIPIHHDEQLNKWKEHFFTFLNGITSGELPSLREEVARHRNKCIRTVSSSGREINWTINALTWDKATRRDDLLADVSAASRDLQITLARKSCESETFSSE